VKAARKADDLLESYVGIRDMELGLLLPRFSQKPNKKFWTISFSLAAQTMVDLGKGKTNVDDFAVAIDNNLGEFEFPDDFVIELWTAIEVARNSPAS
jgi:hypothetical protein